MPFSCDYVWEWLKWWATSTYTLSQFPGVGTDVICGAKVFLHYTHWLVFAVRVQWWENLENVIHIYTDSCCQVFRAQAPLETSAWNLKSGLLGHDEETDVCLRNIPSDCSTDVLHCFTWEAEVFCLIREFWRVPLFGGICVHVGTIPCVAILSTEPGFNIFIMTAELIRGNGKDLPLYTIVRDFVGSCMMQSCSCHLKWQQIFERIMPFHLIHYCIHTLKNAVFLSNLTKAGSCDLLLNI